MSINVAKWTFFLSLCASRTTSFLLFTLFSYHVGNFTSFSHSLSTAPFASGIFIAWGGVKNNLVYQIVVTHRIVSFSFGRVGSKRFLVDL